MSATVSLVSVGRSFGDVVALDDLNLTVPKGRITVLLGPNGAGKTTAIRMITGALSCDHGTVRVFGENPSDPRVNIRGRCGVVSANPALYDRLSGWDNLDYAAALYEVDRNRDAAIRDAANRFGIDDALDQQVGGYSTGMKTRLALARSVLHNPELLLFDEPTSGLDPESSAQVLQLIRDMTATGTTVLMCTHHLVEAEGLADRVVVLRDGTDLASGDPDDLVRRYFPSPRVRIAATEPAALRRLASWPGVINFVDGDPAEVTIDDLSRVPDMIARLSADGVRLTRVDPQTPTLEDLYFAVHGNRNPDPNLTRQLLAERVDTDRAEATETSAP